MIVPNALADTAGILIFDTSDGRLLKEIPVGFEPLAVGVTPDGSKAYLSNGLDATLDVLDLTSLEVTKTIPLSDGTPGPAEFDKLIQVLVFGCAYQRIADHTRSERTLRRRRDEWITAGIMACLERIARDAYDRMIGLNLGDLAVDGCITRAPCGGEVAAQPGGPEQAGPKAFGGQRRRDPAGLGRGTRQCP